MCLFPKTILNKRYIPNAKNRGNVPLLVDSRKKFVEVPCDNCKECMIEKATSWRIRLIEENRSNKKKLHWVTFTYSNEAFNDLLKFDDNDKKVYWNKFKGIANTSVRLFKERLRKNKDIKKYTDMKYWFV